MRCDQCRFWEALDNEDGQCHRYPPSFNSVLMQLFIDRGNDWVEEKSCPTNFCWPVTGGYDWCGEFRPLPPLIKFTYPETKVDE